MKLSYYIARGHHKVVLQKWLPKTPHFIDERHTVVRRVAALDNVHHFLRISRVGRLETLLHKSDRAVDYIFRVAGEHRRQLNLVIKINHSPPAKVNK